jgi:ADP-ribose pyrophosphatase
MTPSPPAPAHSWIAVSEKVVHTTPILDVVEQRCRNSETGKESSFTVIRSPDWCQVLPITESGKLLMIRQYRLGIAAHTLEVPGGMVDPEDTDALGTALREMAEETGYAPLPGATRKILDWCFPNPAILDNRTTACLVGPVAKTGNTAFDESEMIETVEVGLDEIPSRIASGEIRHSLTLMTLFFVLAQSPDAFALLRSELSAYSRPRP